MREPIETTSENNPKTQKDREQNVIKISKHCKKQNLKKRKTHWSEEENMNTL